MNAGKSMAMPYIPRIAEIMQGVAASGFQRNGQQQQIQVVRLCPMDFKEEIGRRLRRAREEKNWTLAELARETGDLLTLKRINSYENGDRMPGPSEAVILSKALGVRSAYLMAVDDIQIPITPKEEAMIRNWRTLNERDRMEVYRKIETMSLQNRDPIQDAAVQRHMPPMAPRLPRVTAHKRVKR